MKMPIVMIVLSSFLIGCTNGSTDAGISEGADIGALVGTYKGTLELKVVVHVVGTKPKTVDESAAIEAKITENLTVYMTIGENTVEGIIDGEGNFNIGLAVNDLDSLMDKKTRDALKTAGCSLREQFTKIDGQVIPPNMLGEVSGDLSCAVLLVSVGTLEVFGALSATL